MSNEKSMWDKILSAKTGEWICLISVALEEMNDTEVSLQACKNDKDLSEKNKQKGKT